MKIPGWKAEKLDEYEIRITAPDGGAVRILSADESDPFNHFLWKMALAATQAVNDAGWRDFVMVMVNRTQSKQLSVTQEELDKARLTDNSMMIINGKYTIMAGPLRLPEDENGK